MRTLARHRDDGEREYRHRVASLLKAHSSKGNPVAIEVATADSRRTDLMWRNPDGLQLMVAEVKRFPQGAAATAMAVMTSARGYAIRPTEVPAEQIRLLEVLHDAAAALLSSAVGAVHLHETELLAEAIVYALTLFGIYWAVVRGRNSRA